MATQTFGNQDFDAAAQQFVPFVAKQFFGLRVDQHDLAVLVSQHNGVGREFQQFLEARARTNQTVNQAALFAHVAGDGQHASNLVLLVMHQAEREANGDYTAAHRANVGIQIG